MEKFRSNLIAVGSSAKVGKTTFAALFRELFELTYPEYKVIKLSLAEHLKEELNPITKANFGIDLFNCSPEEKELTRNLMVHWADIRRKQSDGTFYHSIIEAKVKGVVLYCDSRFHKDNLIFIIDDFRYCSLATGYENDEDVWVKKMGGIIVNINRTYTKYDANLSCPVKEYVEPTNEHERINSREIAKIADYSLTWETTEKEEDKKRYVREFIHWFTL